MKVLLVYPEYPETFWSFRYALKFVAKKAAFPPLGLLTVAAMLPADWHKKLVDMNTTRLTDADIGWADYVFISAMVVQQNSVNSLLKRCKGLGVRTVGGGPLFTASPEEFETVDHLVLGEAEVTLPLFLKDIEKGCALHLYKSDEHPEITGTPVPMWSLINMKNYSSMNVQYSRGCPFNCEFCDIVVLNGRKPRTKTESQILGEMDALYARGWRGSVFIVDDNFIGNKQKIKSEILPALIDWSKSRKYPFTFSTEASINLADDEELMRLMVKAGFRTVFIGIETPNEESLAECEKSQNRNRDLVASVKSIQNSGLEVQGGFIVGFDNDPPSIFRTQINFIQKSGIVTAMVGLLNAPRGTRLYQRLQRENRLKAAFSGDTTDCNFVPKMKYETLLAGYKQVLRSIYSPSVYYDRIRTFLKEYQPRATTVGKLQSYQLRAFLKSLWILGLLDRGRRHFWSMFFSCLFKQPRKFPISISLAIYGYHFRKVVDKYTSTRIQRPAS